MKNHSPTKIETFITLAFTLLAAAVPAAEGPAASETPAQRDARLAWWQEARFGLFIHWGPVSLKGTEIGWSRAGERRGYGSGGGTEVPVAVYDNLYREFNPTNFNAREWVGVAQAAGMRYLVFTSRHHDGFSMFDTKASDYKITSPLSPFKRDVVRELADACHAGNLRFGLYYSPPDWHHPDAFTPDRHGHYVEYLRAQVRELLTSYGRLDILWYDGLGKSAQDYGAVEMNRMVRSLQPRIIINNRSGLPEDFDTPEQRVGKFQNDRPWESCITICQQWAWKPGDRMKSLQECLQTLILCAGGDGNLLFNVGPMPDGRIEPRQVERLQDMGAWLSKYGESIYGTRGGPYKPGRWGASTRRGNRIYLHLFEADGEVILPPIPRKITASALLTGGQAQVRQTPDGITIAVAEPGRQKIDTLLVLDLDGSAAEVAPVAVTPPSLCSGKPAKASNVYQQQPHYGPAQAVDDDESTRWATDSGTKTAWLEVDLGQPMRIGRVAIDEAYAGRVRKFELQYRDGDAWKTCLAGTTIGESFAQSFPPVTARMVRLNILVATDGPTLNELQLFPPNK